jgi:hypothetical protein
VYGNAKPLEAVVIHTHVPVTSAFDSYNEMLSYSWKEVPSFAAQFIKISN